MHGTRSTRRASQMAYRGTKILIKSGFRAVRFIRFRCDSASHCAGELFKRAFSPSVWRRDTFSQLGVLPYSWPSQGGWPSSPSSSPSPSRRAGPSIPPLLAYLASPPGPSIPPLLAYLASPPLVRLPPLPFRSRPSPSCCSSPCCGGRGEWGCCGGPGSSCFLDSCAGGPLK